jgi:hypothetical protein
MKSSIIELPSFGIVVRLTEGPNGTGGSITSDWSSCPGEALSALESLVLAHACAGVDIQSFAYLEGLETAVSAILERA